MKYTKKKNLIWALIIFLSGILLGGKILTDKQIIFSSPEHTIVSEVIDGDTIKIESGELVRLIGIDAPEKNNCAYSESKKYLKNLIENKSVRLEKDILKIDKYNRLLRYVILPDAENEKKDILINQEIIKQGLALADRQSPNTRHAKLFSSAQEKAIKNNLGIWAKCYDVNENIDLNKEMDVPPPNSQCIIKGNVSSRHSTKTYLLPACGNYSRTKIDPRLGDKYFCSEQEAIDEGFSKSSGCPR